MKLSPPEREVLRAAIEDHAHVVLGWDDKDEAKARLAECDALDQRLKVERPPSKRPFYMLQGGEHPEMENLFCDSCAEAWPMVARAMPAGILPDNGRSGDSHTYIMRCDDCTIFADDTAAASFLASLLGEPWMKGFDDESELPDDPTEEQLRAEDARERPYRPYFRLSLVEIYDRLATLVVPPAEKAKRPPEAVQDEALTLERDALRSALAMLRDAIDDEQIADHVPSEILNVADFILDKTQA